MPYIFVDTGVRKPAFGGISHNLLRNLTNYKAKQIHIVFDTYPQPSIKDNEHQIRENLREVDYVIAGPETKRPNNFIAELKNIKFKQAFVKFLINDWATQARASLIKPTQTIFLNYDICYSYRKVLNDTIKEISEEFTCDGHEEADTKIVFHACNMPKNSEILIKCSDTDILIIMLANMRHLLQPGAVNETSVDRKIWVQLGTGNNIRNVDVCAIFQTLGENLCSSLAAFHAFTGCDYNPAFSRRAKVRPFKVLENSPEYQRAFKQMGTSTITTDPDCMKETFDVIEDNVCLLYSVNAVKTVNQTRLVIFNRTYKPNNEKEQFKKKTAKLEATVFPPSYAELEQHMKRTIYIAQVWCNSNLKKPTSISPINYGWKLTENKYGFHLFEGEECPSKVMDIIEMDEEAGKETDENTEYEEEIDFGSESADEEINFEESDDD